MIESEKRAKELEEFTPIEPIYHENLIRNLVRFASLIVIGLLVGQPAQNYLPEIYPTILHQMLVFTLLIVFLVGLFFTFSQLRWFNEKRNKSTNLGGTMGLFGLFLTLICSVLSLLTVSSAVLIPLLGIGLFLTFLGFFIETTRIDEPLVYWFRMNLEVIIRYSITGTGAFLINWSVLMTILLFLGYSGILPPFYVWPGDSIGGLLLGSIGLVLVWGSWYHRITQTLWKYRIEIIRTIELSISQGLILIALIGPFLNPDFLLYSSILGIAGLAVIYLDLYIFKKKVFSNFSSGFISSSQVYASIIGLIFILYGLILIQQPNWRYFTIYLYVMGCLLLYRVWFDKTNYTINRSAQIFVWFFRTHYREVITSFCFVSMALGSFLFGFTRLFLRINDFFDPVPLGLFLVGYAIGLVVWYIPSRHTYYRGMTTSLNFYLLLWGIFLFIFLLQIDSNDMIPYVISTTMFVMGMSVNVWLWKREIYNSTKNTLITIKNTIFQTIHVVAQFFKTYYRELLTIGILSLITYGLVVTWSTVIHPPYWPFLFLITGYAMLLAIWRFPNRHDYFRGVTTTLSTVMILFGLVLVFFQDYQSIIWLSGGIIIIGVVVNGAAWQTELKLLLIQTATAIKNVIVRTGVTLRNFFITVKNAFIQTIHALIHFIDKSLHTIWDYRVPLMRSIMTTIGAILAITGFLSWILNYVFDITWISGLEPSFLISGMILLYIAWFYQVNQIVKQSAIAIRNGLVHVFHIIADFLVAAKNTVIVVSHYIWDHRVDILRALVTMIGIVLISTGIIPADLIDIDSNMKLVLVIGGIIVLYLSWLQPVNHFLIKTLIAIKNFFVAVKDATIQFIQTAIQFPVNTYRKIVNFLQKYYIEIIRYSATTIGGFSIFFGFWGTLRQEPFGLLILIAGLAILYAAWFHHVNQFIIRTIQSIKDAIIHAAHAIANFLQNVKNAIMRTFSAIGSFMQKIAIQLNQLLRSIVDLIIPIFLLILSISALFYGIILILSGVFDPTGALFSDLLLPIPLFGDLLDFLARLLQGEIYEGNILGVFANQDPIFQILVGIGIIIFGGVVFLFVALKKEKMRIRSLLKADETYSQATLDKEEVNDLDGGKK
ncbi:MAG: hypothetical protein ACFFB2_04610 [Promethearchaeota archaeon]